MSEKPILFSPPMVKAILEDRKTMTRRIFKNVIKKYAGYRNLCATQIAENPESGIEALSEKEFFEVYSPYHKGDILWVREKHQMYGKWVKNGKTKTGRQKWKFHIDPSNQVRFDGFVSHPEAREELGFFNRPSIFMPRWAARIFLVAIDIRVEPLQEITEQDAEREGLRAEKYTDFDARYHFRKLWDKLDAKRGFAWENNHLVWVIGFNRKKS